MAAESRLLSAETEKLGEQHRISPQKRTICRGVTVRRFGRTGWWRMQSSETGLQRPNSLLTAKITGILRIPSNWQASQAQESPSAWPLLAEFPTQFIRESYFRNREPRGRRSGKRKLGGGPIRGHARVIGGDPRRGDATRRECRSGSAPLRHRPPRSTSTEASAGRGDGATVRSRCSLRRCDEKWLRSPRIKTWQRMIIHSCSLSESATTGSWIA
jgi:hypothetical protein